MNHEDIIRMAREAGYSHSEAAVLDFERLKRFAELIAKAEIWDDLLWQAETETAVLGEREACCKAIDEIDDGEAPEYRACQEAIRARSEK